MRYPLAGFARVVSRPAARAKYGVPMTKPALAMATQSDSGKQSLEAVIGAHLAEWDTAHVDLAIYGCADARTIARSLDELCRRELGAPVRQALFYQASIGAVAGVELVHGRRVVIKAYQPDRTRGANPSSACTCICRRTTSVSRARVRSG